jgi:hypothetical protein
MISHKQLKYEVAPSRDVRDEWRVEAINFDGDGEVYVTIFSGPNAKERAEEYADWASRDR